jgi:histidine triad (HIT) family protein
MGNMSKAHCTFCDIISGKLYTNILYENEYIISFYDIHPQTRVHVLIVPKIHITSLLTIEYKDFNLIGNLTYSIPIIAKILKLENGFNININTGILGGQEILHLHYHLHGK